MPSGGTSLGSIFIRLAADASAVKKEFDRVQGMVRGLQEGLRSAGEGFTKYVTLPLVGLGAVALRTGAQFDTSMSRVAAVTSATAAEMAALRETARDLGAQTSFSASQAADGMFELGAAGFTANQTIAAMPGLLSAAAAGGMSLADTAELMGATLNGFGLAAGEAGRVSDVLAEAAATSAVQMGDLGLTLRYIAPVAAALGLTLEDTVAAVGLLSDAGVRGEQAGTSLRASLNALVAPSKAAADEMARIGLSVIDAAGAILPFPQIVGAVQRATAGMTDAQRVQSLSTIVGTEALTGFLALLRSGEEGLETYAAGLRDSAGAANEMARVMKDNLGGDVEELGGAMETVFLRLFDLVKGDLRGALQAVTGLVRGLSEAIAGAEPATVRFALGAAAAAAALGPLLLAASSIVAALPFLAAGFTALTGPIGAIVVAVAAVGAALALLYRNSEGFRDGIAKVWEGIKGVFSAGAALVGALVGRLVANLETMWRANGEAIMGTVRFVWDAVTTTASVALEYLAGVLRFWTAVINGDWAGAWEAVKETATAVFSAVAGFFLRTAGVILDGIRQILGAVPGIPAAVTAALDAASAAVRRYEAAVDDAVRATRAFGSVNAGGFDPTNIFAAGGPAAPRPPGALPTGAAAPDRAATAAASRAAAELAEKLRRVAEGAAEAKGRAYEAAAELARLVGAANDAGLSVGRFPASMDLAAEGVKDAGAAMAEAFKGPLTALQTVRRAVADVAGAVVDELTAGVLAFGAQAFTALTGIGRALSSTREALALLDFEETEASIREAFDEGRITAERMRLELAALDEERAAFQATLPTLGNAFRSLALAARNAVGQIIAEIGRAIVRALVLRGILAALGIATGGGGFLGGVLRGLAGAGKAPALAAGAVAPQAFRVSFAPLDIRLRAEGGALVAAARAYAAEQVRIGRAVNVAEVLIG